tara:strand:+ start:3112 stop:3789 length:678 start_codon:yes stop_codon:yes gene_type:complete
MNKINHVAIIMDGNGRWGYKKKKSRNYGHREGLNTVKKIIDESINTNIKYLTLFAFSTENWKRPKKEIKYLFNLLETFLHKEIDKLTEKNIKLRIIGNKKNFSNKLKKILSNSERITNKNSGLQINLALNYGFKEELVTSINNLIRKKKKINEKNIKSNLYTSNIPDPDILIRTGNTYRLSNFMLWQIAYSEIFFIKKLWPDFTKTDFKKIISTYYNTKRNFGGL